VDETNAIDEDPAAALQGILADLDATPDGAIGGAAAAARTNAHRTAAYFLATLRSNEDLPRHAGRISPGKVADAITTREGSKFNRQNFSTNPWCGRMLAALERWTPAAAPGALAEAMLAADAKAPADRRVSHLERENLLLRAEVEQLRGELSLIRGIVARTGRLP
jgi:hypothetical protein